MYFKSTQIPGYNPIQEAHNATTEHMQEITEAISQQIKDEFPDKDEAHIAEIALIVCAKLLEAHFFKKAQTGRSPLER